ncbi:MAG: AgmX/PglI C-terminal domain-containing protein [Polyangiaceae bacterium]|nr:AgmX/PglI C-terminal domain-containing protein [Polyangiaceae bacterium]
MPTDSLLPPKKSGQTGYVIAAALMFGVMVALIVWKVTRGSSEAPPDPPSAVVPSESTAEILDSPPPPPPPPVTALPSASAEATARSDRTPRAPLSGCAVATCPGTAGADLRGALQAKAGQARSCYQNALRNNSTLQGRMSVSVRIGPDGQVCNAAIASDELGEPMVSNCVMNLFRAGKFPPPKGGCVDAAVPMNFVPKS